MKTEKQIKQEAEAAEFWADVHGGLDHIMSDGTRPKQESTAAHKLKRMLEGAEEQILKFQNNLAVNALYAFEWSDSAIEAAATLSIVARVASMMRGGESLLAALDWEKKDLTERLLGSDYSPRSTSVSTNAARNAQRDAAAAFVKTNFIL